MTSSAPAWPHYHTVLQQQHFKNLRGPRGGILILTKTGINKKVNSTTVFPGASGGTNALSQLKQWRCNIAQI
ncbi:hypothetical protein O9992_28205 [Vibrio lentus]|nr:hypothetical protein [Vibrio lentus]